MEYEITIRETRSRKIQVRAESEKEALLEATRFYVTGEFDMEPGDEVFCSAKAISGRYVLDLGKLRWL